MASPSIATTARVQTPPQYVAECEYLNFLVYLDVFGAWRWEFRGADGHFADSRESYESRAECIAAARTARAELRHRRGGGIAYANGVSDRSCDA